MIENQAQLTPTPIPERVDVLVELWSDFKKLKQLYRALNSKRRSLTPELKYQVYILQVRSQVGKSILHGLKDADLDEVLARLDRLESTER